MSQWKYVVFRERSGRLFPVIFPVELAHGEIAEAIQMAARQTELDEGKTEWSCPEPVSAGFLSGLQVGRCGGDSETLGLKAYWTDSRVINGHPFDKGLGWERDTPETPGAPGRKPTR